MPNVMIIDRPQFLASISEALNGDRYMIVAKSSHLTSAMEIAYRLTPDIIILNLQFIQHNISENVRTLNRLAPYAKLLITHYTYVELNSKIPPKVDGLISRSSLDEELPVALETISRGDFYLSPFFMKQLNNASTAIITEPDYRNQSENIISGRELQVLQLILKEHTNQEIAEALHISRRTVEVHKRNLIIKTNSKNIVGLVLYSIRNGLVNLTNR